MRFRRRGRRSFRRIGGFRRRRGGFRRRRGSAGRLRRIGFRM